MLLECTRILLSALLILSANITYAGWTKTTINYSGVVDFCHELTNVEKFDLESTWQPCKWSGW